MQLISVNIGQLRPIEKGKQSGQTGIYKIPVMAPAQITEQGLSGDVIYNKKHHGGPDQAIYIYGRPDYDWWSTLLGQELQPGVFGENLTISELESAQFSIGDRLQIGATLLEVTAPRIPCNTLAARMDDPAFIKHFRQAERPGLYCRVIQPGWVQVGDPISHKPYQGQTVTILEMFRDFYETELELASLQRYLAAPIDIRSRAHKEKQLQRLLAQGEKEF